LNDKEQQILWHRGNYVAQQGTEIIFSKCLTTCILTIKFGRIRNQDLLLCRTHHKMEEGSVFNPTSVMQPQKLMSMYS